MKNYQESKRIPTASSMTARSLCRVVVAIVAAFSCLIAVPAFAAEDEDPWPHEITTDKGLVVMYQPQVDRLDGNILYARMAMSVMPTGKTEPIFGATWLEARVDNDFDTRNVQFREIRVPRVRFPDATSEQEQELVDLLASDA